MTFKTENVNDFVNVFNAKKNLIAASNGCEGVELLRDISNPNIFFTYSSWKDGNALENYRQSELFNEVWSEVKKWFDDKPEAWSVEKV